MNYEKAFESAGEKLVPGKYLQRALECVKSSNVKLRQLISERKIPRKGYSDQMIESILLELSSLDSNNFEDCAHVGEREGRVYSSLVSRRHYGFSHGVGRSGDLTEAQPKAVGSSLLNTLTNSLLTDLIKFRGCGQIAEGAFLMPFATGMALTFTLLSLKGLSGSGTKDTVIWSRIDQKSCAKAMGCANLKTVVVEPIPDPFESSNQLITDVWTIEEKMKELTQQNKLLCVCTTTSCFAPRARDNVIAVAKLCAAYNVHHIVNNAYGIQDDSSMKDISRACRIGRVDILVSSTDKNLMVPVGGSIVYGQNPNLLQKIKKMYPGRGSSSQTLDVLITLLSMGLDGYEKLIKEKNELFKYMQDKVGHLKLIITSKPKYRDLKMLKVPDNLTSIAISLDFLTPEGVNRLGSMLYTRKVTGARAVHKNDTQVIDGNLFKQWGTNSSFEKHQYLAVAASIGVTKQDIDKFFKKLLDTLESFEATPNSEPP